MFVEANAKISTYIIMDESGIFSAFESWYGRVFTISSILALAFYLLFCRLGTEMKSFFAFNKVCHHSRYVARFIML